MQLKFIFSFLESGRKILKNPSDFSCISSADTPADSLKATFLIDEPEKWKKEICDIEVFLDEKKIFEGGCDRQVVSLGEKGCILTVWARSKAAVLLDNEAIAQEYAQVSLDEMFDRHIKPYGFINDLGVTGRTGAYRVGKGMSEWEAFSKFCRRVVKRTPYIHGKEVAFLTHGRGTKVISPQKYPIRKVSNVICRDKIISEVLIRDKGGQYRTKVQNKKAGSLKICRRRCLIPSPEWALTVEDAHLKMKQSMEGRNFWEVELCGLFDWEVGTEAVLTMPKLYLKGNIVSRELGFNQKGAYTRLRVK